MIIALGLFPGVPVAFSRQGGRATTAASSAAPTDYTSAFEDLPISRALPGKLGLHAETPPLARLGATQITEANARV
jgi:hypothetical protein